MNRIKELEKLATEDSAGFSQFSKQRFAELIIEEAMGIIFDEVSYTSGWDSANAVIAKVKEHFGVDNE